MRYEHKINVTFWARSNDDDPARAINQLVEKIGPTIPEITYVVHDDETEITDEYVAPYKPDPL